jgi:hypothetical protein
LFVVPLSSAVAPPQYVEAAAFLAFRYVHGDLRWGQFVKRGRGARTAQGALVPLGAAPRPLIAHC